MKKEVHSTGRPAFCPLIPFRLRRQFPGTFAKGQTEWHTMGPKSPRFWRCVMRYTVFKMWEFPVRTLSDTLMRNLHFPLMPHSEPSQVSLKDHRDCLFTRVGWSPTRGCRALWLPEVCTCLHSPVSLSAHLMWGGGLHCKMWYKWGTINIQSHQREHWYSI